MHETKLFDALQLEAGQRLLLRGRVKARFSLDERKGRGAGVPSLREEMQQRTRGEPNAWSRRLSDCVTRVRSSGHECDDGR